MLKISLSLTFLFVIKKSRISESCTLSPTWQVDLPPILRSGSFDYYLQRSVPGIERPAKSQIKTFCVDPLLGKKLPLEGMGKKIEIIKKILLLSFNSF